VPGLEPARAYRVTDVTLGAGQNAGGGGPVTGAGPDAEEGPDASSAMAGTVASGAALGEIGMAIPGRRPHAAAVYFVTME
jgi:hypothetical protein